MAERDGIRTKVTAGVISGVILIILGYIGRAWWPPVWHGIVWLVSVIWSWLFTAHSIYGWLIVIFVVCTSICGCVFVAAMFRRAPQQNWRSYRQDTFFGFVWRWDYDGQRIDEPVAYCPHCGTQLILHEDYDYNLGGHQRRPFTRYSCDHCHRTSDKLDESFAQTQNKVIRQIDRKLRNDEWKEVLFNERGNA